MHSNKGRTYLGWNPLEVDVQIISISKQIIHCAIKGNDGIISFYFYEIYGLQTIEDWKGL